MKKFLKKFVGSDRRKPVVDSSAAPDDLNSSALLKELKSLNEAVRKLEGAVREAGSLPLSVRENIDTLRKISMKPLYADLELNIQPRIMSMPETVEALSSRRMSLSRFGDGEFKAMLRLNGNLKFQKTSPELRAELSDILSGAGEEENLLVGLPEILPGPHWTNVWADFYSELKPMLVGAERFANSHISRPVYFMQWGGSAVHSWRKVFEKKEVLVVTGKESRFELVDDLFGGARSVEFVRGPSQHAYSEISTLEDAAVRADCDLVLLSLGPAGTALAHRLARRGLQALDVGHISASFNTAFKNSPMPEFTPFK